jgi:hypothetical protein
MNKKRMALRMALAACFLALYYVGAMLAGHEEKADAAPASPTITSTTVIDKSIDLVVGQVGTSLGAEQYTVLNGVASADLLTQLAASPLGQQIPGLARQLASIRDQGGANPSNLDFLNAGGAATELAYAKLPAGDIVQKPSGVTNIHSRGQVVAATLGSVVGPVSTTEKPAGTLEFILDAGTTSSTSDGSSSCTNGSCITVVNQTLGDVVVNVYQVSPQTSVPVMEGWWLLPGLLAGVGLMVRRRKKTTGA